MHKVPKKDEKGERMRKKGENSRISSKHNRGLILKLIATGQCHSRIELARETELTKMTITNIISEFRQQNIIVEAEELQNDVRGRNPITLEINKKAPKVLGILVDATYCEAILCDLKLHTIRRKRINYADDLNAEKLVEDVIELIDAMIEVEANLIGIGIASIGPVNINRGEILNPSNFYGIKNVMLADRLRQRYSYPIVMDSVANSSALVEALFGAGKEEHDFIYLGLGDRIGSGVISQGELFRNSKGYAPEIGHVCIRPQGALCTCGNRGCLQSYASAQAVLKKLKTETKKDLTFREYCEMSSDEKVDKILHQLMDDLLIAIVSSINILHPVSVILGDQGTYIPQKYLKYLENQINTHKFVQGYTSIRVKHSSFRSDVTVFGAACNVIMDLFTGEIELPF